MDRSSKQLLSDSAASLAYPEDYDYDREGKGVGKGGNARDGRKLSRDISTSSLFLDHHPGSHDNDRDDHSPPSRLQQLVLPFRRRSVALPRHMSELSLFSLTSKQNLRLSSLLRPGDTCGTEQQHPYFDDPVLFDSSKIKSWAWFREDDLTSLMARSDEWREVDVLVIEFAALRDMGMKGGTVGAIDKSEIRQGATGGGNERQEDIRSPLEEADLTDSPVKFSFGSSGSKTDSAPTSASPNRSVENRLSPPKNHFLAPRSQSFSSLSPSPLGLSHQSAKPAPITFRSLVRERIKHLFLSINLFELYQTYSSTKSATIAGGPVTPRVGFTRYLLTHIAVGLKHMPCSVAGVLLTGLRGIADRKGKSGITKMIDAIRGGVENETGDEETEQGRKPMVLLDDFGIEIWESVRDKVNGIVLADVFFEEAGLQKVRFGDARATFANHMTILSTEISLRSDFVVLNAEHLSTSPMPALLRAYIHWTRTLDFIPFLCTTGDVRDIRPLGYDDMGDDSIFEMATHPDILRARDSIQRLITSMRDGGILPKRIEKGTWDELFRGNECPVSRDVPEIMYDVLTQCSDQTIDEPAWVYKPAPPHPPPTSTIPGLTNELRASRPRPTSLTGTEPESVTAEALETQITSVAYFGGGCGRERQNEVAGMAVGVMYDLLDRNLLASARVNVDVKTPKESEPAVLTTFQNMVDILQALITNASETAQCVMSQFSESRRGEVERGLPGLRARLTDGTIRLWYPTKAAFLIRTEEPYDPLWAVVGDRHPDHIDIFVADHHPNPIEAVLHAYFKYRFAWKTGECILLESLPAAQLTQRRPDVNEGRDTVPVSERLMWEVDNNAYPSRLLRIIRNGKRVVKDIWSDGNLVEGEAVFLICLCDYLSRRAEYFLITCEAYSDDLKAAVSSGYAPRNAVETCMTEYVGECTLHSNGSKKLLAFATSITSTLVDLPTDSTSGSTIPALCYLFSIFWTACRRCAYQELCTALRAKNPAYLPDRDQTAVTLEMITTASVMREIFDMSSLQLCTAIHAAARERTRIDRAGVVPSNRIKAEEDEAGVSLKRSLLNAYIFVYPVLLDIILVMATGSGIFASERMGGDVQEVCALVFLVIFPVVGALVNSIGRTTTYYFYQKSIPVMISAFYHRLAAAVVVFLVFGAILGGVTWIWTEESEYAVLGALYSLVFGLFMIYFCALLTLRNPKTPFYKSPGPMAVLKSMLILIPNAFICQGVFTESYSRPLAVWGMYIASLAAATGYLAYAYVVISNDYLRWPERVRTTRTQDILDMYENIVPRPTQKAEPDLERLGRAQRRWQRSATEWFSAQMTSALTDFKKRYSVAIRQRVAQWNWENMLMDWYLPHAGLSAPKLFSPEWDGMVKQGVAELKKKYAVEKMNRGDILFSTELPAITFGLLYFILIFIDRWCILFVTGRGVSYFPAGDVGRDYLVGVQVGILCLLLCSGLLELTLERFYLAMRDVGTLPLAGSNGVAVVIDEYRKAMQKVRYLELVKFVFSIVPIVGVATAILGGISVTQSRPDVLRIFGISCGGYMGLLLGLFNKLFIAQRESTLNFYLAIAIAASFGVTCALMRMNDDEDLAVWAVVMGGWGFAFVCAGVRYLERVGSVHYRVQITPALTSSGQRRMGQPHNSVIAEARDAAAKKLLATVRSMSHITSSSKLGNSVLDHLRLTAESVLQLPPTHLLSVAFPSAATLFGELGMRFAHSRIQMHRLKKLFRCEGATYAAVSACIDASTLHVFLSPSDFTLSEEADLRLVAEALVHEYVESEGFTHAAACISEILLSINAPRFDITKSWADVFPERVKLQLLSMSVAEKEKLRIRTEDILAEKACLGVEVDVSWGIMGHLDRMFMVKLAKWWWVLFDESRKTGNFPHAITVLLETAPPSLLNFLNAQTDSHPDINARAAQCLLSSLMAINVKEFCESQMNGELAEKAPNVKRLTRGAIGFPDAHKIWRINPTDWLLKFIVDTRVALFLALTADQRFGREIANQYLPFRLLYSAIYAASRTLLRGMKEWFIYRQNPHIGLLRRMGAGLRRVHRWERSDDGRTRITSIETYHISHTTVGVVRQGADELEEGQVIVVDRYPIIGPKPTNWKPAAGLKAQSTAYYRNVSSTGDKHLRLLFEYIHNSAGKTVKTHIYVYPEVAERSSTIPRLRYVLPGQINADTWSIAKAGETQPTEIQTFSVFEKFAVITEAVMLRTHKATKATAKVVVAYQYSRKNPWHGPTTAVMESSYPSPWRMTVNYAALSTTQGPPRIGVVELVQEEGKVRLLTKFDYSHPEHVRLETLRIPSEPKLLPTPAPTPVEISEDVFGLLGEQPPDSLFQSSDFFVSGLRAANRYSYKFQSPLLQLEFTEYYVGTYSTLWKRENMWASWRRGEIAGAFARDLDEDYLRHEPLLASYWFRRDIGDLAGAKRVLWENRSKLAVELQVKDQPLTRSHLQIKYPDLDAFGLGGDAQRVITESDEDENKDRRVESASNILNVMNLESASNILNVMNLDSGTWPTSGGGVGSCRRDLIAGLDRVRWTAIAEIGSAELVQKDYPIERHINSIVYIPLWDVDFGTPTENVYRTTPYHVLKAKERRTTSYVVSTKFAPMIRKLIRGCLVERFGSDQIEEYAKLFVDFYQFFASYDWVRAWNHPATQEAWMKTWLDGAWSLWAEKLLLDIETPTLRHVEMLYNLLVRLLLPLTVDIPKISVVHASHHGVQSIVGKHEDRRAGALAYQRINPVLNGMDVMKFHPDPSSELPTPVAIMLSHISPVKDVMNAIHAARFIVQEFKLESYQLHIYGSPDKDPPYTAECERAIASYGLTNNVFLKGLGSPSKVLPTGWVFVNSSITEGLPLALGEAGLCGLPVVCTDVGGSREVIRDARTGETCGWVVPPSKPLQLALAQLRVLAVADGVGRFVADSNVGDVSLDDLLAPSGALEERIMDPSVKDLRRKVGMRLRERTVAVFSIARYWREHEQIIALGPIYENQRKVNGGLSW
ncbi:hypothetical protein HK104_006756 [Borealophlyctis nickersoniae]|nr:hypothetical protein HK104_006756 [Borealophlyctis nickersoniae]